MLEPRFTQPAQWQSHFFERDGRRIHYGCALPQDGTPKAMVVVLPGLSEFGAKYYELAHEMLGHGYGFAVIDWMGQGLSGRYSDPKFPLLNKRRYIGRDGFDDDIRDAKYWLSDILSIPKGVPCVMIGHSMGGHLGLRLLHDMPDFFSCAALSAPFLGIKSSAWMPRWLELGIAKMLSTIAPFHYIPGGRDFDFDEREKNPLFFSNDLKRSIVHNYWCRENAAFQVGSPTNGWLYAAVRSYQFIVKKGFLGSVQTPILLAQAQKDELVDNRAIDKAAAYLPHAQKIVIEGASHEILMEQDHMRDRFLQHAYALILETTQKDGVE